MFVCRMCGDITPAPTTRCARAPVVNGKAPFSCELLEEIESALQSEQATEPAVREGRLVMVSQKGEPGPDGKERYVIVWRSLESQWNTTEIYFLGEQVKNEQDAC